MDTTRHEADPLAADQLLPLPRGELKLVRQRLNGGAGGVLGAIGEKPQDGQHERLVVRNRHEWTGYCPTYGVVHAGRRPAG
jgi:hypothetical protein